MAFRLRLTWPSNHRERGRHWQCRDRPRCWRRYPTEPNLHRQRRPPVQAPASGKNRHRYSSPQAYPALRHLRSVPHHPTMTETAPSRPPPHRARSAPPPRCPRWAMSAARGKRLYPEPPLRPLRKHWQWSTGRAPRWAASCRPVPRRQTLRTTPVRAAPSSPIRQSRYYHLPSRVPLPVRTRTQTLP